MKQWAMTLLPLMMMSRLKRLIQRNSRHSSDNWSWCQMDLCTSHPRNSDLVISSQRNLRQHLATVSSVDERALILNLDMIQITGSSAVPISNLLNPTPKSGRLATKGTFLVSGPTLGRFPDHQNVCSHRKEWTDSSQVHHLKWTPKWI